LKKNLIGGEFELQRTRINGRKPKKSFVTFEQMLMWGLSQKDNPNPDWAVFYNKIIDLFKEAVKLFDGSYQYQTLDKDNEGNTIYKSYPNLGITKEDLLNHYIEEFGSRLVARPLEIGRISLKDGQPMDFDTAMSVILDITYRKVNKFVLFNRYKYLTMVKTTDLPYNPIENYRMVEEETGSGRKDWGGTNVKSGSYTIGEDGSESIDRSIKENEVGHVSVSGPIKEFTTTTDPKTGKLIISSVSLDDREVTTSEGSARTSGVEQGKKNGTSSATYDTTNGISTSATTASGTSVVSTNYATTYDDTETDRKIGKAETEGSVGEAETFNKISVENRIMEGTIESGNPSAFGYTDTRNFDERETNITYNDLTDTEEKGQSNSSQRNLTRSGNIGVTTSQQMIEAEREVAKFNIIDDFCRELNKIILLSQWDFN
jgi:hypothetical protein